MDKAVCPCPHEGSREIVEGTCQGCGGTWLKVDIEAFNRLDQDRVKKLYPGCSGGPSAVYAHGRVWRWENDWGGRWISEDLRFSNSLGVWVPETKGVEEDTDVLKEAEDFTVLTTNTSL